MKNKWKTGNQIIRTETENEGKRNTRRNNTQTQIKTEQKKNENKDEMREKNERKNNNTHTHTYQHGSHSFSYITLRKWVPYGCLKVEQVLWESDPENYRKINNIPARQGYQLEIWNSNARQACAHSELTKLEQKLAGKRNYFNLKYYFILCTSSRTLSMIFFFSYFIIYTVCACVCVSVTLFVLMSWRNIYTCMYFM